MRMQETRTAAGTKWSLPMRAGTSLSAEVFQGAEKFGAWLRIWDRDPRNSDRVLQATIFRIAALVATKSEGETWALYVNHDMLIKIEIGEHDDDAVSDRAAALLVKVMAEIK